jgi:site-specific DNA-methyltransferase (adenine-specific)
VTTVGENVLYYSDNLDVLRLYVADESVDLVNLDPPFKSAGVLKSLGGNPVRVRLAPRAY